MGNERGREREEESFEDITSANEIFSREENIDIDPFSA